MPEGFRDVFLPAPDGLRLHVRIYDSPGSERVPAVCLAGLTRNARDFHEFALHLAFRAETPRSVICIDSRGRGGSARDPDPTNYTVSMEAGDVITLLAQLGVTRAHVVGTSRGGLIAHVLAAIRPELLASVVLNDVGPELGVEGLAHIKAYLAAAPSPPRSFPEAEALQRTIHGPAFPALADADWTRMTAAIYRDEDGRPVADVDPAISASFAALDLSAPLPTLWSQFDALAGVPLMAIRGENSRLLTPETLSAMKARRPDMAVIEVPGQGHPPLLETGDLPHRISAFMAGVDASRI